MLLNFILGIVCGLVVLMIMPVLVISIEAAIRALALYIGLDAAVIAIMLVFFLIACGWAGVVLFDDD